MKNKFFASIVLTVTLAVCSFTVAFAGGCVPAEKCKEGDFYCYPNSEDVGQVCSEQQPGSRAGFRIDGVSKDALVPCEGFVGKINVVVCKTLNTENLPDKTVASPAVVNLLYKWLTGSRTVIPY